ncbi:MAG: hypothetical protein OSB14_10370, partial [Planctomycetota bacterium]|nr:hypothetical protein [Planctomycetota bacterium]
MELRACLWASLLVTLSACVSQARLVDSVPTLPKHVRPSRPLGEIVVCGQRIPVNAPVVLWTEAPFYDATSSTY